MGPVGMVQKDQNQFCGFLKHKSRRWVEHKMDDGLCCFVFSLAVLGPNPLLYYKMMIL